MRILFVSYAWYPGVGGIESTAHFLIEEFRRQGHEITVITAQELEDHPERTGYPVFRRPGWKTQRELAGQADLVYFHNPSLRFVACSLLGKPVATSVRTWIRRMDGSTALIDRLKLAWLRGHRVIAVSRLMADHLPFPATVIENAWNAEVFQTTTPWPERHGATFVGRLVSDKGTDVALEAIARLRKNGHELPLTVIGDGPERAALNEQAAAEGIEDLVTFTGRQAPADVARHLNRSRYLLAPSRWAEPFGIVALEGIACGCIPLATEHGGLRDAVGPCGPLFPQDDATALADHLQQLETDPAWAEAFRSRHPEHLEAHRPETVARKYLEVFATALRKEKP